MKKEQSGTFSHLIFPSKKVHEIIKRQKGSEKMFFHLFILCWVFHRLFIALLSFMSTDIIQTLVDVTKLHLHHYYGRRRLKKVYWQLKRLEMMKKIAI